MRYAICQTFDSFNSADFAFEESRSQFQKALSIESLNEQPIDAHVILFVYRTTQQDNTRWNLFAVWNCNLLEFEMSQLIILKVDQLNNMIIKNQVIQINEDISLFFICFGEVSNHRCVISNGIDATNRKSNGNSNERKANALDSI